MALVNLKRRGESARCFRSNYDCFSVGHLFPLEVSTVTTYGQSHMPGPSMSAAKVAGHLKYVKGRNE